MPAENKVLIAIPCGETIHYLTVNSIMHLQRNPQDEFAMLSGSLVYDARNYLANYAIKNGFTHVLFIDSDMTFPSDTLQRLLSHDVDAVTAICYARRGNHKPCAYKSVTKGNRHKSGVTIPIDISDDMPPLIQIDGCGAAMLLVKTEIYNRVCKKCGKIFDPQWNLGEDLSFTERLKKVKVKLYCDTTLTIGHIGTAVYGKGDYDEQTREKEVSTKLRIFGKRPTKP